MFAHEKVMFEIYREAGYDRRYRVVYFTELDEHHRDQEIARAVAGEHFFDGFLKASKVDDGKRVITGLLERLNRGEAVAANEVEGLLGASMA